MEDQRKRTFEALERRFAQAEAAVQTQNQQSNKRTNKDKEKNVAHIESSPANAAVNKCPAPSSRKGTISFLGHTPKQDAELNQPAYLKLSHPVDENLLPTDSEVSDGRISVDRVLHELFQHGDSAQKYMQGSKSMKIESTILLDNFVPKSGMFGARGTQALWNLSKRSKKCMSLKQHKKIGSFVLPQEFHNYEFFKPMHENWKSYALQLLKITGKDQLAQCFLNADLHGAVILVVECKIASYVGIHGIMVRETRETFGIITLDNKLRVVPKKVSVFMLEAEHWRITLHGDKLTSRNLVP